jgi:hypothetical protein
MAQKRRRLMELRANDLLEIERNQENGVPKGCRRRFLTHFIRFAISAGWSYRQTKAKAYAVAERCGFPTHAGESVDSIFASVISGPNYRYTDKKLIEDLRIPLRLVPRFSLKTIGRALLGTMIFISSPGISGKQRKINFVWRHLRKSCREVSNLAKAKRLSISPAQVNRYQRQILAEWEDHGWYFTPKTQKRLAPKLSGAATSSKDRRKRKKQGKSASDVQANQMPCNASRKA